jgi:hypothetical protein
LRQGKRPAVEELGERRRHERRPKYMAKSCHISGMSHEDELAKTLQECLSLFQSGLLQDIDTSNLAFCEPSQQDDPRTPPLRCLATENSQFLKYQGWITKLILEAEKLDCEGFERCIGIKSILLGDLQNEWAKLEKLKRSAWQLASQNARPTLPSRPNFGPNFIHGIDTCECHSNPMR